MVQTITIDARICVPDVGTFHYVGKVAVSDRDAVRDALDAVTLDEVRRGYPYNVHNGIRMYGTDDLCRRRKAATFGTLDALAREATMHVVIGGASEECERYLEASNAVKAVEVCEAFSGYAGVYVAEWSFEGDWSGIPDSERPLLSNSDS